MRMMEIKSRIKGFGHSLRMRWQLVLIAVINLPTMLAIGIVGYVLWAQAYSDIDGMGLLGLGFLLMLLSPVITIATLITVMLLFWYLWKLGRVLDWDLEELED